MFMRCWQAYRWEQPPPLSLAKLNPNPAYTRERPPSTETQVFSGNYLQFGPSYYLLHTKLQPKRSWAGNCWGIPNRKNLWWACVPSHFNWHWHVQLYNPFTCVLACECISLRSFESGWHLFDYQIKNLEILHGDDVICNIYSMIIKSSVHTWLIAWTILYMCMPLHFCVLHQRDQDFFSPL